MSAQPPVDPEHALQRLRHDLANPLAALLAEVQLLLLDGEHMSPEVRTALRGIEAMAVKMRTILRS